MVGDARLIGSGWWWSVVWVLGIGFVIQWVALVVGGGQCVGLLGCG